MPERRTFLKQMSVTLGALAMPLGLMNENKNYLNAAVEDFESAKNKSDKDFWRWVRSSYSVSPNIINLNNGGVSPQPIITQNAQDKYNRMSNEAPSHYMWHILDKGREPLRENLATLAGVSPEEIAINRNTTEGLNTIIFGLDLKKGDEIVLTKQDYPNMMNAWKQREKRDGVKLNWVNLNLPSEDEDAMVKQYVDKFTDKTKLVHITHLINWMGQIIPVRKIADEAKKRGIEVLVDGAHSFALLDFKIPDLNCDYFATSLHKFMCAPFGSGLMYVKKDKISKIWALLSANEPDGSDIRKFESLGTRSFAKEMAIGYSLDFHNTIGSARKQNRLHELKYYWSSQVKKIDRVNIKTSLNPNYSCAISTIKLEGMATSDLNSNLWKVGKIHAVGMTYENIDSVRITPNVYTSFRDLDRLLETIEKISKTL